MKYRRKKKSTNNLSKSDVELLSKRNVKKILQKTDKLKSWGKTGYMKSERLNKWYHFRSSIELSTLQRLDNADSYIEDFDTECFYIPYKLYNNTNAATLNYVPDIITKTVNGTVFVIEVKPASQLQEEKNLAKWNAATTWCWSQGARFLVITEKDVDNLIEILRAFEDKDITKAKTLLEWQS